MPSEPGRLSLNGKIRYCDADDCMVKMPEGGLCTEHRLELDGIKTPPTAVDTNLEVAYTEVSRQVDEKSKADDDETEIPIEDFAVYKLIKLAKERRANA